MPGSLAVDTPRQDPTKERLASDQVAKKRLANEHSGKELLLKEQRAKERLAKEQKKTNEVASKELKVKEQSNIIPLLKECFLQESNVKEPMSKESSSQDLEQRDLSLESITTTNGTLGTLTLQLDQQQETQVNILDHADTEEKTELIPFQLIDEEVDFSSQDEDASESQSLNGLMRLEGPSESDGHEVATVSSTDRPDVELSVSGGEDRHGVSLIDVSFTSSQVEHFPSEPIREENVPSTNENSSSNKLSYLDIELSAYNVSSRSEEDLQEEESTILSNLSDQSTPPNEPLINQAKTAEDQTVDQAGYSNDAEDITELQVTDNLGDPAVAADTVNDSILSAEPPAHGEDSQNSVDTLTTEVSQSSEASSTELSTELASSTEQVESLATSADNKPESVSSDSSESRDEIY